MYNYFENVGFKYPFRDYQKQAIDSSEKLMEDGRIHIVAAPGSGKTILGLELVRRLNSPVLILVPTINLRDQWLDRFFDGFVKETDRNQWQEKISEDLSDIKIINCVTYQALFSYLKDNKPENLQMSLKQAGVKVLCLDEAHHLKNEWWKALESVVELMEKEDKLTIIALTATPPYDSDNKEWLRYSKLCGEIDVEINAPSMVKNKCICPYQDYIYICVPDESESEEINMLLSDKKMRMNKILKSKDLYREIMSMKGLKDVSANTDVFMANPEYLDAIIAYINSYATYLRFDFEEGKKAGYKAFFDFDPSIREMIIEDIETELELGDKSVVLKKFKEFQMSEENFFNLLSGILVYDISSYSELFIEKLKDELTHLSFYRDGQLVKRRSEDQISSILKNSNSQFDGIEDIVAHERINLKNDLRCLILTDRIRKESLDLVETEEMPGEIGCVSIWENLRRNEHLNNIDSYMNNNSERIEDLGMLTANLAIVPDTALEYMKEISVNAEVKALKSTGYFTIDIKDSNRKSIVALVTELFNKGIIRILTGTIALLGEGWDAPWVNSVIMASNLATYVQTNQIRGRGFRINKSNPEKTANLWHLFCVRPCPSEMGKIYEPGTNAESLFKRFDTIIGIAYDGKSISSGIDRVLEINEYYSEDEIKALNENTLKLAGDRKTLYDNWHRLTNEVNVEQIPFEVNIARDTEILDKKSKVNLWESIKRRFFKDKNYTRSNILAKATLEALKKTGQLKAEAKLEMNYDIDNTNVSIRLKNVSNKENKIFTDALNEILGKITNSRYLIMGVTFLDRKYVAVPSALDRNKEGATVFFNELINNKPLFSLSKPVLIYTQNVEGKRHLIKARLESYEKNKINVEIIRRIYGKRL